MVKSRRTMRAADGGYAVRFSSIFLASSFFRFDGESTLAPAPVTPAVETVE